MTRRPLSDEATQTRRSKKARGQTDDREAGVVVLTHGGDGETHIYWQAPCWPVGERPCEYTFTLSLAQGETPREGLFRTAQEIVRQLDVTRRRP